MNVSSRTDTLKLEARAGRPALWARVAAWSAFACTVPSAIWRVLMIQGLLPGTAALRQAHSGDELYVWALSAVQLAAGFLAVGLVRPWGERLLGVAVPRWIPVVFGMLGGCAVTYLFTVSMTLGLIHGDRPDQGLVHDGALLVMVLCYAPIFLWGPLELAAVAAYAIRRGAVPRRFRAKPQATYVR